MFDNSATAHGYQLIPADDADPIVRGTIDLPKAIAIDDLERMLAQLFGEASATLICCENRIFSVDSPKTLPRNDRATAIRNDWLRSYGFPGKLPDLEGHVLVLDDGVGIIMFEQDPSGDADDECSEAA
jgi:hypothetical protein